MHPQTATAAALPKRPGPLKSIFLILTRLHTAQPLQHEVPPSLLEELAARVRLTLHVTQRTARILATLLLRACVRHPLGWTVPQEVVCMLMFGILQSRQVPAWRAFFAGVGDLQLWVPVVKEKVTTGSCESWWLRLQPDKRPQQPRATINWLYLHGGAFVAGDALMYAGAHAYWMVYLAKQGIDCAILSVEYPLAPESPFPAGVNAAADAIHWLLTDSGQGETPYFLGGDSAGGNLAVASLALLRDAGKLSRPPLGITLISPAVDLTNASVFGSRGEPVSCHFEQQQQQQEVGASLVLPPLSSQPQQPQDGAGTKKSPSPGAAELLLNSSSFRRRPSPQQQQQQQHLPPLLESQPSVDCKLHAAHTAGGKLRPAKLLRGLLLEAVTTLRVHASSSTAQEVAASGWFDYLPADGIADELHCYVKDPCLLEHPLVSPTRLQDFTGLCQQGMLVVAGGAELMRPDIAAFAAQAARAGAAAGAGTAGGEAAGSQDGSSSNNSSSSRGFAVVYHEEPDEPHVFPVLMLPHLMKKGLVVPRFVAALVGGEEVEGLRVAA